MVILLLLSLCLEGISQGPYNKEIPRAQQTFFQKYGRAIGINLYHMATNVAGSLGDAYNDEGKKNLGHALKAGEAAMLIGGPILWKVQWREGGAYLSTYVGHRIAEYDLWYGLARDLGPMYNGQSSTWDKTMNKIPPHGRSFIKGLSFGVAFVIPFKYKL